MLNEEQMKLVEDNHSLIYSFISNHNLELSEWYGIIAESLMKAVRDYDESKGKLSSLFYSIAKRDVASERRRIMRARDVSVLGITDTIEVQNEPSNGDFYMEVFMDGLDDSQKEIVRYLYEGRTQSEIAKLIGVNQSTVSRRINCIREKVAMYL